MAWKKPGGDFKQTWQQLALEETQADPEEETEEEDVLAQLGLADNGKKQKKDKTTDKQKEKETKRLEKERKANQAREEKFQKYMQQVDACSGACDTAIGKKNLSKMAGLVLKEVRALKALLDSLLQAQEALENALVEPDLDLAKVKEVLTNSAAVLKANKRQA